MADYHPDPQGIETREDLSRALSALRAAAGLTVRDLVRRLDAPVATIGDYFSGRHLPSTRQLDLFRSVLDACGVTDPTLRERWIEALARLRQSTDGRAARGPAPYRGLAAVEDDADLFFRRLAAVEELLGTLRRVRDDSPDAGGAVAVVGPSGSGKTSLFIAGLLPALRAGALDGGSPDWEVTAMIVVTGRGGTPEVVGPMKRQPPCLVAV